MTKLEAIKQAITGYPNCEIYFNEPVVIRNHHISVFECWAVSIHEGVWLMDERGLWHKWQETDLNAGLVMDSVYQHLKALQLKAA